jgi:hypothetical protein
MGDALRYFRVHERGRRTAMFRRAASGRPFVVACWV